MSTLVGAIGAHRRRTDILVRLAYVLGNVLAENDAARRVLAQRTEATSLLVTILSSDSCVGGGGAAADADGTRAHNGGAAGGETHRAAAADKKHCLGGEGGGGTGTDATAVIVAPENDAIIKVICVLANLSINCEAGSAMALDPAVVKAVLGVARRRPRREDIAASALITLNNLSFYPMVLEDEAFGILRPMLLEQDASGASSSRSATLPTEAARVLANLTRRAHIRRRFLSSGDFARLVARLPDDGDDADVARPPDGRDDADNDRNDADDDRERCQAFVGVVVNMLVDGPARKTFYEQRGVQRLTKVVIAARRCGDWSLGNTGCQALWNFYVDEDAVAEFADAAATTVTKRLRDAIQINENVAENGFDEGDDEDLDAFIAVRTNLYEKLLTYSVA